MNRRTKRVASLIRGEVARLLLEDVSDPELDGIVVTEVKVTDDLRLARVYYSAVEGDETLQSKVRHGFRRAAPFLRRKIGESLNLRYVPELRFEYDQHFDSVNRVMRLLDGVDAEGPGGSA